MSKRRPKKRSSRESLKSKGRISVGSQGWPQRTKASQLARRTSEDSSASSSRRRANAVGSLAWSAMSLAALDRT